MRILFHVEPLVMHGRPFHYWAWLDRAAAMARHLAASGWDARVATNLALAGRAVAPFDADEKPHPQRGHGIPREHVVVFTQCEIREIYDAPNLAILEGLQHGHWSPAQIGRHAALITGRLAGFEPDVVVTYTPSDALRAAYPDALILHSENGMFSREPAPPSQFFDPHGLYGRSLLATHAAELQARAATDEDHLVLGAVRGALRTHHVQTTPFAALEGGLRDAGARLALVPLQFGGEAGFELNAPFRTQGEYLFHVLEQLPDGVVALVCEHPIARWLGDVIDDETREWLRDACPQALFVAPDAAPFVGQALLHHVDATVCVSSSLGLQSLLWRKPLAVVGHSHLAAWSDVATLANLREAAGSHAPNRDGAFGWLMRHYFVPERRCLADAGWLDAFLKRGWERWRAGVRGLEFYDAIEPAETMARLSARSIERESHKAQRRAERLAKAA